MQEKSLIKQNILQYIEYLGISKYDFYKKSGITRGVLDQTSGISEENTTKFLAYAPEVNIDWLLTGKGKMISSEHSELKTKISDGIPMVPIDALAGKQPGELVIHDYDIEQRYFVPEFSKADFLIRVKGSSMYPKYSAGDILACLKIEKNQFIQWNKAYVIDTSQGIMVKRIIKGANPKHWVLRSDNKDYQDIDVNPDEDVNHINLVLGVIRLE